VERGLVFRGSIMPPLQAGEVPALPSFGGFFLFIRTPFIPELPNLTWKHTKGWGSFQISYAPTQSGGPSAPQFWGSPVFMPPSFNAERPYIWHGNWQHIWGGHVLGQPCHCLCTSASRGLSATAELYYRATLCVSAVFAVALFLRLSLRPSVRPSVTFVFYPDRWLKISSNFLLGLVGPSF